MHCHTSASPSHLYDVLITATVYCSSARDICFLQVSRTRELHLAVIPERNCQSTHVCCCSGKRGDVWLLLVPFHARTVSTVLCSKRLPYTPSTTSALHATASTCQCYLPTQQRHRHGTLPHMQLLRATMQHSPNTDNEAVTPCNLQLV